MGLSFQLYLGVAELQALGDRVGDPVNLATTSYPHNLKKLIRTGQLPATIKNTLPISKVTS